MEIKLDVGNNIYQEDVIDKYLSIMCGLSNGKYSNITVTQNFISYGFNIYKSINKFKENHIILEIMSFVL